MEATKMQPESNWSVDSQPLVLLGSTASGKSELAVALIRALNIKADIKIDIIVADSMQVYRGMDIGTAKPSFDEQAEIRHHCLNLVEPSEDFSVQLYQQSANSALDKNVKKNKRRAIIVGGTGLYIRAVVDNLQIPATYPEVREELEKQTDTNALWEQLNQLDPKSAATMLPDNRRRIIRSLEVAIGSGKLFSSYGEGLMAYKENNFFQVGIRLPREKIDERIDERYELQMEAGFLDEVKRLSKMKLSKTARQALGYKELLAYLNSEMDLSTALDTAKKRTKRFARRQERWFRRDPRIKWISANTPQQALPQLLQVINSAN